VNVTMLWRQKPKNQPNAGGGTSPDDAQYRWNDNEWRAPSYQHWYAGNSDYQADERRYWRHQVRALWANVGIGIATLAAALTAAGIAYWAYRATSAAVVEAQKQTVEARRQAKAAEDQVGIAGDTEYRQLRAYVVLTDLGVFCPDCGDSTLTTDVLPQMKNTIRCRIENNGQTPAYDVTAATDWVYVPEKNATLSSDFAFPDHKRTGLVSKSDLGRDKHKDGGGEIDAKDILLFKNAVDGNATIFIYGHVDYCDIFNKPHSTAYCFLYVPHGGLHLPLCDRFNGEIDARGTCDSVTAK
jgi:hypothetical protein